MTSDPISSCDVQTCLRGLYVLHSISGVAELIGLETESWIESRGRERPIVMGLTILPIIYFENAVRNWDFDPNWQRLFKTDVPVQDGNIFCVRQSTICN
jgi:hypothetical protein